MRAWLRDTAGGLPATYWYLWTGLLINRVGGFAVLFLTLYLTAQRGASTAVAGLVVGTYGLGGVLGTLLGGVLTDRRGRRATLLWSHFACVAVLAGLALSTDLKVIAGLCVLLGVTQSMPGPAFVAAIIDVVPADRRSRAFNLQFWAFNLGMAGASLLAGVLAQWSYVGLFLIDAATTLATGLLIAWKVPETLPRRPTPDPLTQRSSSGPAPTTNAPATVTNQPIPITDTPPATAGQPIQAAGAFASSAGHPDSATDALVSTAGHPDSASGQPDLAAGQPDLAAGQPDLAAGQPDLAAGQPTLAAGRAAFVGGGLRSVLADRVFLVFVGLTLMQALLYSQTNTIVPLAMRADGLAPSAYGLMVALGGALIVVGQLFVPRLIDGHRKDRVLAVSMVAMAAGFATLSVADRLPAYLAAAVIWTVGSMLAAPPNAEINSELAPALLRGRYQSVFFLTFPAASFLAPAWGGAGLQYLGDAHWLIVAAVGAAAAALHLAAGPSRERRVAAIRSETAQTATIT